MELIKKARETDKLLTQDEAATVLGVESKTLQAWRTTHRYPLPYVKMGRCVRYRRRDLDEFIERRTVSGQ